MRARAVRTASSRGQRAVRQAGRGSTWPRPPWLTRQERPQVCRPPSCSLARREDKGPVSMARARISVSQCAAPVVAVKAGKAAICPCLRQLSKAAESAGRSRSHGPKRRKASASSACCVPPQRSCFPHSAGRHPPRRQKDGSYRKP